MQKIFRLGPWCRFVTVHEWDYKRRTIRADSLANVASFLSESNSAMAFVKQSNLILAARWSPIWDGSILQRVRSEWDLARYQPTQLKRRSNSARFAVQCRPLAGPLWVWMMRRTKHDLEPRRDSLSKKI